MSNLIKKTLILTLVVLSGILAVKASVGDKAEFHDRPETFFNYIEGQKLNSSRYSRPEDLREVDPETFIPITTADALVYENDDYELYLNRATINFKVRNKDSGYIWATAIDDPIDAGTYDKLLRSGIGIEYINKHQQMSIRENVGIIDTEFTVVSEDIDRGIRLNLSIGGYCATMSCRNVYDDYLAGNRTLEQMIRIGFTQIDVDFALEVTLDEHGLVAHIPYDSIEEKGTDWITLSSIILFPGMGAAYLDEIPGYMVIPDGVGTLIRYDDNDRQFSTPFEARFYGANPGITTGRVSVSSHPLSMPIFGAVHGVRQNGFIAIIEEGDMNARLLAHPNGARNVDYNLIYTKFDFRQTYRQSFSSDGSGGSMRTAETAREDIRVRFNFLNGDAAHYTGIATNYRDHLKENGTLNPLDGAAGQIPIHLQFLMADSKSRFIGNTVIEMTSVDAARAMYDDFYGAGLQNQRVSLLGWNKGGYSGHLPSPLAYETSLGRRRDFEAFIDHVNAENQIYLVNNYHAATNQTGRISYRRDVATGVNRFRLERTNPHWVYTERYMLFPESTARLALRDLPDFEDRGVKILHEGIANVLFSYYDQGINTRADTYAVFEEVFEAYQSQAGYYYPNAYAYAHTDSFFHVPLYNSQLKYFDDLVPILPVVLSGHMELYSEFLNYNSLGRDQLLALIDFGINPAFILSENRASALRGSDIEHYYTSNYATWRGSVIEEYNFVNEALRHVIGRSITDRTVFESGIVEVTYDNGVRLLINYTSRPYETEESVTVAPLDYHVSGVAS